MTEKEIKYFTINYINKKIKENEEFIKYTFYVRKNFKLLYCFYLIFVYILFIKMFHKYLLLIMSDTNVKLPIISLF